MGDDEPAQDGNRKRSADDKQSDSTADPAFEASMTFASIANGPGGCDCDECGVGNYLPNAIALAVKRHKAAIQAMPLKRTQHRALGKREQQVSVYAWTLPADSEPLVEFGNSHRFIWIQRLPETSVIKAIGKGIIGSADEEKQRVALDWKQGDIVFVPSNGGKAVGWVHHAAPSSEEGTGDDASTKQAGHIVLQIAKVPVGATGLSGNNVESEGLPWYNTIRDVCRKVLEGHKESTVPTNITLDSEDAALIRESMQ
jgi:hypothetical protein